MTEYEKNALTSALSAELNKVARQEFGQAFLDLKPAAATLVAKRVLGRQPHLRQAFDDATVVKGGRLPGCAGDGRASTRGARHDHDERAAARRPGALRIHRGGPDGPLLPQHGGQPGAHRGAHGPGACAVRCRRRGAAADNGREPDTEDRTVTRHVRYRLLQIVPDRHNLEGVADQAKLSALAVRMRFAASTRLRALQQAADG
jgi:hypothetical protein